MKDRLLKFARAEHIPIGFAGKWRVTKMRQVFDMFWKRGDPKSPMPTRRIAVPAGVHTYLYRYTEATMHSGGELVMKDVLDELETHLEFMLRARGRVLITGLGLGCVARGCLANPNVSHVTIIERDPDVLKLVRPHFLSPMADAFHRHRFTIVEADAIEYAKACQERFDCAWHDLWSDPDKGEPNLALIHSELLKELCKKVPAQGAWAFPKSHKRAWQRLLTMY